MLIKLFNGIVAILLLSTSLIAQVSSEFNSVTADPANSSLSLRSGTQPPREGVDLYVFDTVGFPPTADAPYGTKYTVKINTAGKPGAVVAIPGQVMDYQFSEGTSGNMDFPDVLTIDFVHSRYANGIVEDLPGPETDFAIAIIPTVDDTQDGPPAAMAGSYMSTNLSPLSWTLIPPSDESSSFGFSLNGPVGESAFFDFFIPQTMIDLLSAFYGETLTAEDLAIYNNDNQISLDIEEVAGGAKFIVDVIFDTNSDLVDEQSDIEALQLMQSQEGETTKAITVDRAKSISLASNKKAVRSGQKARLFGWVKDCTPGLKVKISSKGIKALNAIKGITRRFVSTVIGEDCMFSKSVKINSLDRFTASYKPTGGDIVKSDKLRVGVTN